ncbi:hypothetical protein DB30_05714 [Enhygromyxa salina]|uniref:Ig-like domain-containing protein n=1 Tax=Enhygromyxa salina TaxID=215803 RepID=A0A0C2D5I0_9BACT|nr:hypothetical protein [Enhygromyxa salina]KIG15287.1 hypothetical protein DB30_05714 [Enhygromyxa salina]
MSPARPRFASLAITFALLLASVACTPAGLAQISAEPTACPSERLEISEAHQPMEGPSSWTATCLAANGADAPPQKWFCSRMHQRVICTEDPR